MYVQLRQESARFVFGKRYKITFWIFLSALGSDRPPVPLHYGADGSQGSIVPNIPLSTWTQLEYSFVNPMPTESSQREGFYFHTSTNDIVDVRLDDFEVYEL